MLTFFLTPFRSQDTITLYEERLESAYARQSDLESALQSLETQLHQHQTSAASAFPLAPPSPASMARQASTAAEIDNENLTAEIKHMTGKIALLEEQMEEMQIQMEKDEERTSKRLERGKEKEEGLRKEVEMVRELVEEGKKREEGERARRAEVEEALKEGGRALENARAEVESLRAEVAVSRTVLRAPDEMTGKEWVRNAR